MDRIIRLSNAVEVTEGRYKGRRGYVVGLGFNPDNLEISFRNSWFFGTETIPRAYLVKLF